MPLARTARNFFKDFDFLGPESQKNRWPAGICGSESGQNSLMIGNILEIDRLSKDWKNRWHYLGDP